ncbi:IS701 family transposase [Clostridium sp. KNHs214]|uniref:IS701 family transposase n=1 Tax=Clostridium sp. KNHs214 TaxID=1540257 RepID=UPI0005551728|nr:IS701 family transposase [Clostridium sp. KNHs214]
MSTENNIPYNKEINNFIIKLGLSLYLTLPQLKHVCEFIFAAVGRGYDGKVIHIAESCYQSTYRTSIGQFLSKSPWNEDYILRALQKFAVNKIWQLSRDTGKPIYVIIDDTICKKTKPSSRAKNPIEKCQFHQSHLENKKVYGHQVVGALLQCGDVTIPYQLTLYDKTKVDKDNKKFTKINIAVNIISSLPEPPIQGFVLGDSWYSAEIIIKTAKAKGFEYIGALKTNRIIYPKCSRMNHKINGFAKTINKEDFHLVTVNKHSYYVYRYEGKINGFKNVVILISYPKEALYNEKALKSFISTDINLTTEEILFQYRERWTIEVFFRQNKMELGFDNYQVRGEKAIKRFWILTQLTYLYCTCGISTDCSKFGEGLKIARKQSQQEVIAWVYSQYKKGVSLNAIFDTLKLSHNKCA